MNSKIRKSIENISLQIEELKCKLQYILDEEHQELDNTLENFLDDDSRNKIGEEIDNLELAYSSLSDSIKYLISITNN